LTITGRVARKSPKASHEAANAAAQRRLNRRNRAKQVQTIKRQALVSATRIFDGVDGTPRIVAVIPLSEDVDSKKSVCALAEALDVPTEDCPEIGVWRMR
jgi:pre-rRNA-processing protein TSR1